MKKYLQEQRVKLINMGLDGAPEELLGKVRKQDGNGTVWIDFKNGCYIPLFDDDNLEIVYPNKGKDTIWEIAWDGYYPYCKLCSYEPSWSSTQNGFPSTCPICGATMTNYKEM